MAEKITKVGICMPCINLWAKYTKPALDSVRMASVIAIEHSPAIACEVMLIDNGSTDETKEMASKESKVGFEYVRNEEMWGFQKSVNFGAKHFLDKGFDYVLVLNNDIELHPQAIVRLVERFEKHRAISPVASMVTCLDVTGECNRDPAQLYKLSDKDKQKCEETPHPCFSAFMIDQKCWEITGEFDEVFAPAYYEDNDYHYRMQLAGLLAITYPPAMFFHWASRTQLEALGRPLSDTSNQHAQYVRKWGGDPGKEVFVRPYNLAHEAITSVKQNKP